MLLGRGTLGAHVLKGGAGNGAGGMGGFRNVEGGAVMKMLGLGCDQRNA